MEFLRFGSSIPGGYWGCCACDIIQNFKVDPDAPASIQLVNGDGGTGLTGRSGGFIYAGMTYRDIFWQRLRYGTFSNSPMANHAFFAILANSQLNHKIGQQWLAILKEAGFEFIRLVNNSVWNVDNYIFALIRNVGGNACKDQFTPPKQWTDLPSVVTEPWTLLPDPVALTATIKKEQLPLYDKLPKDKFYTEAELVAAKVPVIMSGLRSEFPQQTKDARNTALTAKSRREGRLVVETAPLKGAPAPVMGVTGA